MKFLSIFSLLLVAPVLSQRGGDHRDNNNDDHPSTRGGEHGPPSHKVPPHLQQLVDACKSDVNSFCGGKKDIAKCLTENYGCLSSECSTAITTADNMEREHHGGKHGREHDGEHGGEGKRFHIPDAVLSACLNDKVTLCPELDGREAMQCMMDKKGNWSIGCTSAVTTWKSTMPTPSAELVAACKSDMDSLCPGLTGWEAKHCMKEHRDEVSQGCKDAYRASRNTPTPTSGATTSPSNPTGTTQTGTTQTSTDSTSTGPPSSSTASIATSQVVATASVLTESLINEMPTSGSSVAPCDSNVNASANLAAIVNAAYNPDMNAHGLPLAAKLAIGGGVSIFAIVALAVVVRRYRARRAAASTSAPSLVVANPLSYNQLPEENNEARIVQGVIIA